MLITSDEIVDTKSEMKKNLHAEYGIDGVTDPFKINSTNVFGYEFQVCGRTQWFLI